MLSSRDSLRAEYLSSDSPDESDSASESGGESERSPQGSSISLQARPNMRDLLHKQESCDFGFIDQHDDHDHVHDHDYEVTSEGDAMSEVHVDHTISAATLKFRPSTVLTEKIITEVSDSIRVFKPSRSLHELVSDREASSPVTLAGPTASIDLVVSGGGLKGYFVCGCVSVLQRQLVTHNIHIARVSGASAGAWSGFFICTGVTTAMWMESYYKCYDNPNR
jgi:hypothetical protein